MRFKRKRKIANAKIYEDKRDLYCMNARTGNLNDFITNDYDDGINVHDSYEYDEHMSSRFNRDPVINEYGRDLINLCTASGLRILNGSTLGDTPAQVTCFQYNGSSTVDYCLTSKNILSDLEYFKVDNPTLITVKLKVGYIKTTESPRDILQHSEVIKYKWQKNSNETFRKALAHQVIRSKIATIMNQTFTANNAGVTLINDEITQ